MIICPACALFNQALINASQLTWLIEQQANTANNLVNGSYEPPPPKPSSQLVPTPAAAPQAPLTRGDSKIPVPQQPQVNKPAQASPKPPSYAAAARAKPAGRSAAYTQMQSHGGNWRAQVAWEDETKRLGVANANRYVGRK
ncbi:hypothetical protein ABW21_db0208596 [Orbilia brochopaga]|nr:hypothetical protein ABW21_db0208596 [Drechslerella brochopaga]